ncbi:MAG: hypothetical protein MI922_04145 [Bacteroidales bacterium]|nr:hypothetical protein [Bacteroidales bacterium]
MKNLISFLCLLLCLQTVHANNIGKNRLSFKKDGNTLKIPYFRNHSIGSAPHSITRVIVVIHGTNRNGNDYYANMMDAANKCKSALNYTMVIAPVFLTEDDISDHKLGNEYPYWSSNGWKDGSLSKNNASNPRPIRISSFEIMDLIIQKLLDNLPNIEHIIITGHSAGGQFTQRYLASSIKLAEIDSDHPLVSYEGVVANPSSYVYMDGKRVKTGTTNTFKLPSTSCSKYNK